MCSTGQSDKEGDVHPRAFLGRSCVSLPLAFEEPPCVPVPGGGGQLEKRASLLPRQLFLSFLPLSSLPPFSHLSPLIMSAPSRKMEDSLAALKSDIVFFLSRLQHGSLETSLKAQDPVFEGMVRDLQRFDESLEALQGGVARFLEGTEHLCAGLSLLSEAAVLHLTKKSDACIARDACLYREAVHRITRADAPHAAYAKLKRDLQFNVTEPLRKHREHNAKLRQEVQIRNRRLAEWLIAQKKLEHLQEKFNAGRRDEAPREKRATSEALDEEERPLGGNSRLLSGARPAEKDVLFAEAAVETARLRFKEVDDVLFEWLQMLDAYKCDIFDSALQTLKYLQYEFFASSAHAVAKVLPSRMEFRPMVEMTPQLLLPQVELELAERAAAEERGSPKSANGTGLTATERLVEKWEREASLCTWITDASSGAPPVLLVQRPEGEEPESEVTVDILSLAVLTAQGFEETFAKRALQKHENDTQAAMDWLLNGGTEELQRQLEEERRAEEKPQSGQGAGGHVSSAGLEDVRLPTTLKWVEKLKAAKRKERQTWQQKRRAEREAAAVAAETLREQDGAAEKVANAESVVSDRGAENAETREPRERRRRGETRGDMRRRAERERRSESGESGGSERVRDARRRGAQRSASLWSDESEGDKSLKKSEREEPSERSRKSRPTELSKENSDLLGEEPTRGGRRQLSSEDEARRRSPRPEKDRVRDADSRRQRRNRKGEETSASSDAFSDNRRERRGEHERRAGGERRGEDWVGCLLDTQDRRSGRGEREKENGRSGGRSTSRATSALSSESAGSSDWDGECEGRRERGRRERPEDDHQSVSSPFAELDEAFADARRGETRASRTKKDSRGRKERREQGQGKEEDSRGKEEDRRDRNEDKMDSVARLPPLPDLLGEFDSATPGQEWDTRQPSFDVSRQPARSRREAGGAETAGDRGEASRRSDPTSSRSRDSESSGAGRVRRRQREEPREKRRGRLDSSVSSRAESSGSDEEARARQSSSGGEDARRTGDVEPRGREERVRADTRDVADTRASIADRMRAFDDLL
ncbi:hypothetical protein NCLIV_032170 [Neospora caninum Liverpool]|uniref:UBA domain-containing protein n=1 Tax=Neospora caninum (strain Liverpool) TaxID=572307 RepID=F0VI69_NEOCL|nr:hypothetical protein NCLIV_032170 [Neospora caninum Liverpool]CBZ53430.1 hypothetical protein NCLIV_032170 [Neospora caninum Liverpool]CEL67417.1 TPA: hypothetical protein BN1204_032170 [Neospora caninum Liverpool]|eukprot:XP_003883462.1 hypothetical protein NCLIV_032170 [Neospora caninum Liverpool]